MNWFATELHCHTIHSDGKFSVSELLENAKVSSLDGIALTDHNTISGWADLPNETGNIAILKGIEWTTFFGHMLVMDCPVFVDWRDALPDTIDEKTSQIRSNGGIVGIAHPFELGSPMCTGCYWDYHIQKWENVNYIEVWSETFPSVKTFNHRAVVLWNSILDLGHHVAATYGRDWHGKKDETVPCACTYLGTDSTNLTAKEMKNALLLGQTAITMGPKFIMEAERDKERFPIGSTINSGKTSFIFLIDISVRQSLWKKFDFKIKTVRLVSNGGKTVEEAAYKGHPIVIEVQAIKGWYRGELWGSAMGIDCCLALTSPIYCT